MMTNTCDSYVPIYWDLDLLECGVRYAVPWDFTKSPHLLIIGPTGSGKTVAAKLLLGRIRTNLDRAQVVVCDFKHDDFAFLEGCARYYSYVDCERGLEAFYKTFEARQSGADTSRDFRALCFDEWAAYLSVFDKKSAEIERKKMAALLMLGRAYACHVICVQQRADAVYFEAARDNFGAVVALGNLSRESREMLFAGVKDRLRPVTERGQGHMLINGNSLTRIQVPFIRNMAKLESVIRKIVE